jgi:4-amino-4-deoxy-L-arabinose transferase-like glycosyltransferase
VAAIILAAAATLENGAAANRERRRMDKARAIAAQPPADRTSPAEPITRLEAVLLAVIIAAGTTLRLIALAGSGVEHFDEGVYASNLWCHDLGGAYPDRRFYAPPLLPALIETGMLAGLPPSLAAMLPAFLAGCGTIVALWWFGRSWFGPSVGLAAATLAALSQFHIAYSAAALTDVLLGLWLILAVDAIARSLAREDFRWAISAGLYTGLAWWTKYNGWLPLAIEAAALPILWLVTQLSIVRKLGCFATTAAIAAAVWSPYYFSLASGGGYGPIAANHRQYVVGFAGWLDSATRQIAAQHTLNGLLTATSLGLSLTLVRWLVRKHKHSWLVTLWEFAGTILLSVIFGVGLTTLVLCTVLAACGIIAGLRTVARQQRIDAAGIRQAVVLSLLAAWWLGLLVATPCYWPYPRLLLSLLLVSWLGTAICFQQSAKMEDAATFYPPPQWVGLLIFALLAAGMCIVGALRPESLPTEPAQGRRGLRSIAEEIRRNMPAVDRRAVYVAGEPALFFQLCAAGETLVAPTKDVPPVATYFGEPIPTYLVAGPHAHRDPQFIRQWATAKDDWQLVSAFDYKPSPLVWLDLQDPRLPDKHGAVELNRIQLYRRK